MRASRLAFASLVVATVFGVSGALAAPKAPNYGARTKQCQAATKGMYSGDGRVFAYGACLPNIAQDSWGPSRPPQR
ncbi:MAG: hypothetical protein IT537_25200 [Hyphomicrobiales bacterium]|nr:hypothetical protein [Hyphomicrobiales bacterium]